LTGNFPGLVYLAIVPLLLLEVTFAIGLGVTVGVLNVFFRDVGQFFTVSLQFWFWFTPVVYPLNILPEAIRPWIESNPMTPLMTAYQDILVSRQWPNWYTLLPLAVLAFLSCLLGYRLFRKRAGEIVDEL
jgi:lipopolysaccharide transport system permease protein